MKRLFVFLIVSLIVTCTANAQKKAISQAQSYIKSGSNLDKAEKEMRTLLTDSANRENMKIWNTLTEAVRMQYEQGNEKLYLKQKSDTATLFLTARKMFLAYESMDSVDAVKDKKGRSELKYRKKNAAYLNRLRPNLYNGGVFFVSKQNYNDAFFLFDAFLDCHRQPLFSAYKYDENSKTAHSAAYLALYCGVKLHNNDMALKYSEKALDYMPGRENTLQYLANIYQEKGDSDRYTQTLKLGVAEFPKAEYFFTRLVDYYNGKNMADSALSVANSVLDHDPNNTLYLYAKSNIMLNMGKYDECVAICDTVVALDDTLSDVYYNAGIACINLALVAQKNGNKTEVKKQYKRALPYMERYRALAPEQKDKWTAALYNIYLNLNMGKKFEEIVKIIQNG